MARYHGGNARMRSDLSTETQPVDPAAPPTCVHHWLLGEPASGVIEGSCQRCGEQRQYSAALESTQRFDDYRELTAPTAYGQRLSA